MHERLRVRASELGPREAPITVDVIAHCADADGWQLGAGRVANFAERTYRDVTRARRRSSRHTTRLPCSKSKPRTKQAVSDFVQGIRISCQGLRVNEYISVRASSSSFDSHKAPEMLGSARAREPAGPFGQIMHHKSWLWPAPVRRGIEFSVELARPDSDRPRVVSE